MKSAVGQFDPASLRWLLSMWREDLKANRTVLHPGFHAVAVHRFGVWSLRRRGVTRWLTSKIYVLAYLSMRNVYGVELPRKAQIGRRLRLPHPMGVVVHGQSEIGDDCMIRQNVTIGQFNYGRDRHPPYAPKLGKDVWVGAGAVIVGGISVGDGARIGPNAVVMTDVPNNGFVFAREAAVMDPLGRRDPLEEEHQLPSPEATSPVTREISPQGSVAVTEFIALIHETVNPGELIEADTPLISTGIVDSFDVAALLTAVEDRFGVAIAPEDVDVDWFDTPTQMISRINSIGR